MELLPLIFIGIFCLGMTIFYCFYCENNKMIGKIIRGTTILSLLILVLVFINLKEMTSLMTLFYPLALSILLMKEILFDQKEYELYANICSLIANVMFFVGMFSVGKFEYLAILGGGLIGMGLGIIICGIKQKDLKNFIAQSLNFCAIGIILGLGIMGIIGGKHIVSGALILSSAVLMCLSNLLKEFLSKDKYKFLPHGIYIIALAVLSFSLYFF